MKEYKMTSPHVKPAQGAGYQELQLVTRVVDRDKSALSELYDRYSPALYGVIVRIVQDEAVAQDVLQEAFMKIWSRMKDYKPQKGRLFTWLLRIARNAAIDKIRSKHQKQQSLMERGDVLTTAKMGASVLNIDHIGLPEIVAKLQPKYRKIIDLMYFGGYTQAEVAEELALPLGTVKTRSRKAIQELRKIML